MGGSVHAQQAQQRGVRGASAGLERYRPGPVSMLPVMTASQAVLALQMHAAVGARDCAAAVGWEKPRAGGSSGGGDGSGGGMEAGAWVPAPAARGGAVPASVPDDGAGRGDSIFQAATIPQSGSGVGGEGGVSGGAAYVDGVALAGSCADREQPLRSPAAPAPPRASREQLHSTDDSGGAAQHRDDAAGDAAAAGVQPLAAERSGGGGDGGAVNPAPVAPLTAPSLSGSQGEVMMSPFLPPPGGAFQWGRGAVAAAAAALVRKHVTFAATPTPSTLGAEGGSVAAALTPFAEMAEAGAGGGGGDNGAGSGGDDGSGGVAAAAAAAAAGGSAQAAAAAAAPRTCGSGSSVEAFEGGAIESPGTLEMQPQPRVAVVSGARVAPVAAPGGTAPWRLGELSFSAEDVDPEYARQAAIALRAAQEVLDSGGAGGDARGEGEEEDAFDSAVRDTAVARPASRAGGRGAGVTPPPHASSVARPTVADAEPSRLASNNRPMRVPKRPMGVFRSPTIGDAVTPTAAAAAVARASGERAVASGRTVDCAPRDAAPAVAAGRSAPERGGGAASEAVLLHTTPAAASAAAMAAGPAASRSSGGRGIDDDAAARRVDGATKRCPAWTAPPLGAQLTGTTHASLAAGVSPSLARLKGGGASMLPKAVSPAGGSGAADVAAGRAEPPARRAAQVPAGKPADGGANGGDKSLAEQDRKDVKHGSNGAEVHVRPHFDPAQYDWTLLRDRPKRQRHVLRG